MFTLKQKLKNGVRIGQLHTPHGMIHTPFFMPVGTVGSVKAMMPAGVRDLGAEIILCNTYHLYLRPGEKNIKKLGGLHKFMNWNGPILTDSGGYQVFSLAKGDMVKISKDGVDFKSHLDGSSHFFTPEKVIDIQLDLGVDILMPLDVCPSGKATRAEVKEAVRLTTEWAKRAKLHFDKRLESRDKKKGANPSSLVSRPLLHGIIQGGLDPGLRKHCTAELIKLDFDGYSVGGLAVDFETRDMWKIVKLMGEILPENKQRYLMGIGTPDDIIKATKLGMDMFDCVLPTRLARHGSVYVKTNNNNVISSGTEWSREILKINRAKEDFSALAEARSRNDRAEQYELINLLKSEYRTDSKPIDKNCGCPACAGNFSRAYISHLLRSNEILGIRLTTMHNLWVYLDLMKTLRDPGNL